MKVDAKLDAVRVAANSVLSLHQHDGDFSIRHNGQGLMHSHLHASELLIGELACAHLLPGKKTRILIGGLGLGYTLKAVLEHSFEDTQIDIYELVPKVVEWNRIQMYGLNGHLLNRSNVFIHEKDVIQGMQDAPANTYDAVIFDIDNGPMAMVANTNGKLYSQSGISSMHRILKAKGRAAIWSAEKHQPFEKSMKKGKFRTHRVPAKTHANAKSFSYQIYIGDKIG